MLGFHPKTLPHDHGSLLSKFLRPKLSTTELFITRFWSFQAQVVLTVNCTESLENWPAIQRNIGLKTGHLFSVMVCCGPCFKNGNSQTEIYPVQSWSLAMLLELSSRQQPQHWIKYLDPWVQDFYPVLGCSSPPL